LPIIKFGFATQEISMQEKSAKKQQNKP